MGKLTVLNEIRLKAEKIQRNGNDSIIIDIVVGLYDTFYMEKSGECFVFNQKTAEKTPITELNTDTLYDLYGWLEGNWRTATSRDHLIELSVTDKIWAKEPEEIRGVDDEVIGLLGVAVEETIEGEELRAVVFISPDGSFATLTMFGSGDGQEKALAKTDLRTIAERLQNIEL